MSDQNGAAPCDPQAEATVLSSCISVYSGASAAPIAVRLLDPSDFYDGARRKVFTAIRDQLRAGAPTDEVAIRSRLEHTGELAQIGGWLYLSNLIDTSPLCLKDPTYHCGLVRSKSAKRRALDLARSLQHEVAESLEDTDALLTRYAGMLAELRSTGIEEPYRLIDFKAIAEHGIPKTKWLLPGWIVEKDLVLLAGKPGIGKSTAVGHLAACLAAGLPWFGATPARPLTVLYCDEEQGEDECSRMFPRIFEGLGIACPETLIVPADEPIHFTETASFSRFESYVDATRPDVVIMDSVQTAMPGINENQQNEVAPLFSNLKRLRKKFGCAFVLLHHTRKSSADGLPQDPQDSVRGSGVFQASGSAIWVASRSGHGMKIEQTKRRGGGVRQSLIISYEQDGEDGQIRLLGEAAEPEVLRVQARAQLFYKEHFAKYKTGRTGELIKLGKASGFKEKTCTDALSELVGLEILKRLERGFYELAAGAQIEFAEGADDSEYWPS